MRVLILMLWTIGCSGQSNTVTAIAIHPVRPEILYVTTNDRIYKSRDGGESWTSLTEGLGAARVLSLAIHPSMTSTVYAGTLGDAVYRSVDGGQRWTIINAGLKEHVTVVNAFTFHPKDPNTIYAATTVGIFKTTNAGMLWEEMPNKGMDSVYVVPILIDHANPTVIYVGTSGGVYRSNNGGQTWGPRHRGMIDQEMHTGLALGINTLAQDPDLPAILYAGTTRGAYKTTNGGESWSKIADGLGDGFVASIVIHPHHTQVLYAGTSKGMLKSTDGSQTWTAINQGLTNLNVRSLVIHPTNPQVLYAGTHGGLFKTVEGGATWIQLDLRGNKETSS